MQPSRSTISQATTRPSPLVRAVPILLALLLAPAGGLALATDETPSPPRADLSGVSDLVSGQRFEEAEAQLGELQADFPDDPAILALRGELLVALGRPADAVPLLVRADELDSSRKRVQFVLGTALAGLGQTDRALEAFAREIEHNRDAEILVAAHLNRAVLLQGRRDWDGAAAALESVIELAPDRVQVFGDLATVHFEAGRIDAAAAALERGRAGGFVSADHEYGLGARLFAAGRYEDAVGALERAIAADPDDPRAERSLATALDRLGRHEQATPHFARYLELFPDAEDADEVARRLREAGAR